jgi:Arc/MetJ family transcription regulator
VRRLANAADDERWDCVIFKSVEDGRPYPAHDLMLRDWAEVPPRQVRLDQLITTKKVLALDVLLDDDSTFYGDLFPHVVQWHDELYLEDGLHRALRAALQQRTALHARVLNLDAPGGVDITTSAGQDAGLAGADLGSDR